MALSATEAWRSGFVVNTSTGAAVLTTSKNGATYQGGFLRDADGRLVIAGA